MQLFLESMVYIFDKSKDNLFNCCVLADFLLLCRDKYQCQIPELIKLFLFCFYFSYVPLFGIKQEFPQNW